MTYMKDPGKPRVYRITIILRLDQLTVELVKNQHIFGYIATGSDSKIWFVEEPWMIAMIDFIAIFMTL